jgi:hypothetical protein
VAFVIAGALLIPYIYAEYEFDLHGEKPRVLPMPVEPVAGRWFDDYFVVETVVIASHLHFDHVGALGRFDKTALIDEPSLRARARDSQLTLRRYEFLGFADRLAVPTFRVDEWWPIPSDTSFATFRMPSLRLDDIYRREI